MDKDGFDVDTWVDNEWKDGWTDSLRFPFIAEIRIKV